MAIAAVLVCGLAPMAEEGFFRGFGLPLWSRRFGGGPALVLSSDLFAIAPLDPLLMPSMLLAGLGFGWPTLLSGVVLPAILAHATFNSLSSFVSYTRFVG